LGFLAGRPQALELELEAERVVQVAVALADVAAADQAHGHAAAFPLHAGDRLDQLAVLDRVVVPTDHAPVLVDRVQERQVDLFGQPAPIAVAQVDHAGVADQIAGTDAGEVLPAVLRVPLVGGVDAPAVARRAAQLRHPGRLAPLDRLLVGRHHLAVLEVVDLADAGGQALAAVLAADQAGGQGSS